MTRALFAVGALLALAFLGLRPRRLPRPATRTRVAADNLLAENLTRAIAAERGGRGGEVDLRALAPLPLGPRARRRAGHAARADVSAALGSEYKGDAAVRQRRPGLRLRPRDEVARIADYRGRGDVRGLRAAARRARARPTRRCACARWCVTSRASAVVPARRALRLRLRARLRLGLLARGGAAPPSRSFAGASWPRGAHGLARVAA